MATGTSQTFNFASGAWVNNGWIGAYPDENTSTGVTRTVNNSNQTVWEFDLKGSDGTRYPSGTGEYFWFLPGTSASNGTWYHGNTVPGTRSGRVITFTDGSGQSLAVFTETDAFVNGAVPYTSTGPTVSSITVANQNSSTRNFTVTHTGTLSASDICYTINGTDVTTLPSPNTGITNLQTTPTGSTFDSYTPSLPYGSHSINIGETFLNFFNANSTSLNDVYSSNNGITVTFPDINSGVYENNLGTVDSGVNTTVTYGADIVRIYIESANSKQITRIAIYQNWAAYVANTGSFKVLYQFWDYENLTNNSPSYTSGVFYPDPDALYETTGSPNQTLTFPTGIQVGTFEWNFATAPTTQINPPSTSSEYNRGSNYDDRFPLITTNLFNRQRSVYAIGMTHKDTWDLFL